MYKVRSEKFPYTMLCRYLRIDRHGWVARPESSMDIFINHNWVARPKSAMSLGQHVKIKNFRFEIRDLAGRRGHSSTVIFTNSGEHAILGFFSVDQRELVLESFGPLPPRRKASERGRADAGRFAN